MKTRTGFVSNSSSSSFVIAVPSKDDAKIKINIEVDLENYGDVLNTVEDVEDYIMGEYACSDDTLEDVFKEEKWVKERYDKMVAAINAGKKIIVGCFCSDEDGIESYLCDEGLEGLDLGKDVDVIEGAGGY